MEIFREVFPGIRCLELPLPFELHSVNVFLVALDEGYLLIDCGMETDAAFETFRFAMQERGLKWTDIREIVLTHMHPDHMGMTVRLLELSGAKLSMHEAEAYHLSLVTGAGRRIPWLDQAYSYSGVPKALEEKMEAHFFSVRQNFHPLNPERLLAAGDEIPTALGPFEVVWTSGHSPGHICLYSARHKLLFSGDQILEKITPNIAWYPDRDMLAEFLESLELLAKLEVDIILPSHGAPFSGHRKWIAETAGHHQDRCVEIIDLIAGNPRTAHMLVAELWRKRLSPINHHFAVFEVLAHLEYLKRQGRVRDREHEGTLEWYV